MAAVEFAFCFADRMSFGLSFIIPAVVGVLTLPAFAGQIDSGGLRKPQPNSFPNGW
jgi:hypothetical protein